MSSRRFRIAFSFAGEKRDFVKKVALILAAQFGEEAILYDNFHNAELARSDLAFYLPNLYEREADLIVAVLCTDYEKKEWCGLEWKAIYSLLNRCRVGQVMLTRFDGIEGLGLRGHAGYIDLDGRTPEQTADEILERLALNEGLPRDHYIKSTSVFLRADISHNLPTLQPFFGREDELKKIADALHPESRTWGALINGPGGMGKTSLAVRAAYDAPPEVFKKIIFISLKTRELDFDGLRDRSGFILSGLAELFNELARELGCEDIAKAPEDQRPRLLLEKLRGAQTLLVLDNLESLVKRERDTLFTFLNRLPSGCKAILTARGRIDAAGREIILQKLSQEAALATLEDLAQDNPLLEQTSEAERLVLYSETAGKPLLLRWSAGQLGRGHCLTFSDALHFIRSCPKENDPLEFIFGDLVEYLNDAEIRALCALSYFSLPAKVEDVALIAGLKERQADHALRKLTVRSLAVPADEMKSFTLVPMVADFLRKKRPELMGEIGDSLEKRAYELIMQCGQEYYDRFCELDRAWSGIAPALTLFMAGDNARLQLVCSALRTFLDFTGRYDEHLVLSEKAECAALESGDYYNAGSRVYQAGYIHRRRGQSDAVLICAERAVAHWSRAGAKDSDRAYAVDLRGIGLRLKGNLTAAMAAHREAFELHQTDQSQSIGKVICLNWLARVEYLLGRCDLAERHYGEALCMSHALNYTEGIAYVSGNLADLALARQDWPSAESLARKALLLSERIYRKDLIAEDYVRLAHALVKQGKGLEALPHARRAVEIYSCLYTNGAPDLDQAQETLMECEGGLALRFERDAVFIHEHGV